MEARAHPLCGAASAWGWQGPGGPDRRRPARPLAAQQQPRAEHGPLQSRSRLARPPVSGGRLSRVIRRTAVYGPVRTVVWEGRHREMPPYPDQQVRIQGAGPRGVRAAAAFTYVFRIIRKKGMIDHGRSREKAEAPAESG